MEQALLGLGEIKDGFDSGLDSGDAGRDREMADNTVELRQE